MRVAGGGAGRRNRGVGAARKTGVGAARRAGAGGVGAAARPGVSEGAGMLAVRCEVGFGSDAVSRLEERRPGNRKAYTSSEHLKVSKTL